MYCQAQLLLSFGNDILETHEKLTFYSLQKVHHGINLLLIIKEDE